MSQKSVEAQVAEVGRMDRESLKRRFEHLYGRPTPPKLSEQILRLAVAYRLQEQAFGGLAPKVREALIAGKATKRRAARSGTVLIREWHGEHHTVTVQDEWVTYKGKQYPSLSAVARLITRNSISGPVFFGLKKRKANGSPA